MSRLGPGPIDAHCTCPDGDMGWHYPGCIAGHHGAADTTQLPTRCPYCGRANDHHAGKTGTTPEPGSFGICWDCHRVAVFDTVLGKLVLRTPTEAEQAEIDADPEVRAAQAALRESYTPLQAANLIWRKP